MNEIRIVGGKNKPAWKLILALTFSVLVIIALIIIALGSYSDGLNLPIFNNDPVVSRALHTLESAETKLRKNTDDTSAHLDRVRSWLVLGNIEGAELEWSKWKDSSQPDWGEIGRSLQELKTKTDEIRALLHEAETSTSPADKYPPIYALLGDIASRYEGIPKYRALFLKGYLLLREGRRGEAEPIFARELNNYEPLISYVRYNHARSVNVSGSEEKSLELFEKFIEEYPSSRIAPLAHLERINILKDLGKGDEAIVECRRLLDRYPKSAFAPKALRKWAEIHEERLEFDIGADIRVRIVREYPDTEEASATIDMFFGGLYALSLLNERDRLTIAFEAAGKRPSEALPVLAELADSQNLSAEDRAIASHGACRCEFSLGHYFDSIDWGNRAIELAPGSESADRAGIRNGWSYARLNKNDLAMDSFRKVAFGKGPLASLGAQSLYERAFGFSDLATVREACTLIIEEYPSSEQVPAALTMLAYLGCRDGLYQSARGYASRCLTYFPDSHSSAEAGFWLARSLQGLGRSSEAEETYKNLAEKIPWDYWGIRASEAIRLNVEDFDSIDPLTFNADIMSSFSGGLAIAWELYDAGTLELAEDEFRLALANGEKGAGCGLALVAVEQNRMREGIVALRSATALGEQAFLTPARQKRVFDNLYPRPYENEVITASLAHDVPSSWLWGAMRQESSFNPNARSSSDARGLLQIMPQTGRFIASQRGISSFDVEILWDPETNIDYSAWYFSYLREQVGGNRLLDILACYNGGPGAWRRYRQELPGRDDDIFIGSIPSSETRNFARWVYANVMIYERILRQSDFQTVYF